MVRYLRMRRRNPDYFAWPGHLVTVNYADDAANAACSCGLFDWSSGPDEESVAMMIRTHRGLATVDPQGNPPFTAMFIGEDPPWR